MLRYEPLHRTHLESLRKRKWISFENIVPVRGAALLDKDGEVVAIGGRLDGMPWGREAWMATSDLANRHSLSIFKAAKRLLEGWWRAYREPIFATSSHEMSHKTLRRLGFRVEGETQNQMVRWKYVGR